MQCCRSDDSNNSGRAQQTHMSISISVSKPSDQELKPTSVVGGCVRRLNSKADMENEKGEVISRNESQEKTEPEEKEKNTT